MKTLKRLWASSARSLLIRPGLIVVLAALGGAPALRAQNVVSVSAGHGTSFYLKSDGTVWAAGWNDSGQLGDGNSTGNGWDSVTAPTPVLIMTGASGVSASASGFHTVFLKADGTVWAVGDNSLGQLGDGSNQDRVSPVQVMVGGTPIGGVKAVSAGSWHSLLLKTDGTVWACGYNISGQLGDESTQNRNTAVQVTVNGVPLSGVKAISAGDNHSLFLKTDGTVWAVGENWSGQLGDGVEIYPDGNTYTVVPFQVPNMSGVKAIEAASEYSLFLKTDGRVFAVGGNTAGQFGNGTTTDFWNPVRIPVQTQTGIAAISARGYHSLFLKDDGTLWGAGENTHSELGDGTTVSPRPTPVKMRSHPGTITAIAAGLRHSLYVQGVQGGVAWATGSNMFSALGDGNPVSRTYPQPSFAVARHHRIAAGPNVSNGAFSLKSEVDGTVWGMGSGYGTTPAQVAGLTRILSVSPGFWRSTGAQTMRRAALDENGKIWTWNTTASATPTEFPGITNATAISDYPGSNNVGVIRQRSAWVISWPNEQAAPTLTLIKDINEHSFSAEQIANGGQSFLALDLYGVVWSWGVNYSGQLGDGTTTDRSHAAPVLNAGGYIFDNVVCVASGYSSSYAVKGDGSVWAWGSGHFGDGTVGNSLHPIQVPGLYDAVAIYSSGSNRFVLKRDGRVLAWGSNFFGNLGDNSTTTRTTPVIVKMNQGGTITDLTRVVEVSTNGVWTFFRREDGTVYACGYNNAGQLGGGASGNRLVATLVADY